MLIFISGIEGIPQDLYEAATIDGANIFDRFFQITLPLLKGVIRTCVTFWLSLIHIYSALQLHTGG